MKHRICHSSYLLLLLVIGLSQGFLHAQNPWSSLIGTPAGINHIPVRFGQVTLDGGNLHLDIPIYTRTGRERPGVGLHLYYNSQFWTFNSNCCYYPINPVAAGWSFGDDIHQMTGAEPTNVQSQPCPQPYPYGTIQEFQTWTITGEDGTEHSFFTYNPTYYVSCNDINGHAWTPGPGYPTDATALSGDGYRLVVTRGQYGTVYTPNGSIVGGDTPNGNLPYYERVSDGTTHDSLGTVVPDPLSCPIRTGGDSAYLNDTPYAAKPSVTCSTTAPSWDGSPKAAVTYTFTYSYIPVCTEFAGTPNGQSDFCGGIWVPTMLALPDGTAYSFTYDEGTSPGHYGTLTGLTLPTGGTMSFSYSVFKNKGVLISSVTDNGGTTSISYATTNNGTSSDLNVYPITVTYPSHSTSPSSGPVADKETYDVSSTTANGTTTSTTLKRVQWVGGTAVRQLSQDYLNAASPTFFKTTWLETGDVAETDITYSNQYIVTDRVQKLNGAILRKIHTDYLSDTSSTPYVSTYNMINYPVLETLSDGNGNTIAQTQYTYDEYSAFYCSIASPSGMSGIPMLTSVTGAAGHDDSRDTSYVARGNPTSISSFVSGTTYITEHRCYDTLGNVTGVIDGNGNATRYSYADNFSDTSCLDASVPTGALRTGVTNALGQMTTSTYNSCLRKPTATRDPNDRAAGRAGTTFTYDSVGRSLCTVNPDLGSTCLSYSQGDANHFERTQAVQGNQSHSIATTLDAFGNTGSTVDQQAQVEVDYAYDSRGLLSSQSVPHASGSAANSTAFFYDGLQRITFLLQADGQSARSYSYNGPQETVTDENGNPKTLLYDALGRLSSVLEGTPGGSTNLTSYAYDALDNISSVSQGGGRNRTFTYDGLSRLLTAVSPETGKMCYGTLSGSSCFSGYDGVGNLVSKTDARMITTTSTYDAINRLTSKSYSGSANGVDATATSCFQYDVPVGNGSSSSNAIGRLTAEWTQAGYCPSTSGIPAGALNWKSILAYDPMGRILKEQQCAVVPCTGDTGTLQWAYDLAGNLTSSSNGAGSSDNFGIVATSTYDPASRLSGVKSTGLDPTHPETLLLADATALGHPAYGPFGLIAAQMGIPDGSQTALLTRSRSYDQMGRVADDAITSSTVSYSSATPDPGSPGITVLFEEKPIAQGVVGIADSSCDNTCGSGYGGWTIDGVLQGGFSYSPGDVLNTRLNTANLTVGPHQYQISFQNSTTNQKFSSPVTTFQVVTNALTVPIVSVTVAPQPLPSGESGQINIHNTCNSACGQAEIFIDNGYAGSVAFDDNGDGVNFTSNALSSGSHPITVNYFGNGNFSNASGQNTFTVADEQLPVPKFNVTFNPTATPLGEHTTVTISSDCNSACGNGPFFVDGNFAGGYVFDSTGNVQIDLGPYWNQNHHTFTLSYSGDSSHGATNGGPWDYNVIENNLPLPTMTITMPAGITAGSTPQPTITFVPPSGMDCTGVGQLFVDGGYSDTIFFDAQGNVTGLQGVPYVRPEQGGTHTIQAFYWGNTACHQQDTGQQNYSVQ